MRPTLLFLIVLIAAYQDGFSQGPLQNLDFESANPSAIVPGNSAAALFPGWQVLIGGTPTTSVGYDVVTIGAPAVEIWDNKTGYIPIQGNYTAFLQSATLPSGGTSVVLSQTGIIPTGSESIDIEANQEAGSSFVVSFDGVDVNMVPLESYSGYTVYGGNVSAWSGENATLDVTELPPSNQQFSPSLLQLDDISFSPNPIGVTPEPSPLVLTAIGGILFALYRRFVKS